MARRGVAHVESHAFRFIADTSEPVSVHGRPARVAAHMWGGICRVRVQRDRALPSTPAVGALRRPGCGGA
ncbi:hypothetical protein WL71_06880 [Burkholderia ubonensis]|uniref:Uncharacterized protein n=1 Tax=Burkholderia ubonensis TaxID=101571 RepID=A0A107FC42_9BURK|nr:hypothetical protein WL70_00695 [Burkholderia ubonensis]KWD90783.1 hypothetical protein WL71_06880 [Burkholderia ubonensis]KWE00713.1 hypothetical protein WL72_12215 [Burkholderia ubonensis]KWE05787.1 hypothetical protein WL73_11475 [Burkholderia ubonensis]